MVPEMTRLSEKGQVVIPKAVRDELGLEPQDRFLVFGRDDAIVLKRYDEEHARKDFEEIAKPFREYAEKTGLTRQDVIDAVREYRRETSG